MSSANQDPSTPPYDFDASDSLLGRLVDEYFDMLQRGENPSLEAFADRYPDQAETIRHALPALQLVGKNMGSPQGEREHEQSPRSLGDYRIIGEIGRGGMGVVYEAEQLSLGRIVALKVLPFAAILDSRQIQRFKNEANAAAMLHHNNIVPIYGVGCERGIYYYAMQYIEGQTLADVISDLRPLVQADRGLQPSSGENRSSDSNHPKSEPSQRASLLLLGRQESKPTGRESTDESLTSREGSIRSAKFYRNIAGLGVQIARALAYAHREGVIHRDIKPSNLMIDGQGKIWITDFGLARIEAGPGVTLTGDVLGTLRYMSPEQLQGSSRVSQRSDVYSLGATLFELLALRPVITDASRQETIRQILEGNATSPRKSNRYVPKELETIVLKAIEKDPQDRYESADELADDLQRFIDDVPIAAKRPTIVDMAIKWSRRHSDLSWAAAFFLLVGFVGTVISTIWVSQLYREADQLRLQANESTNIVEETNKLLRRELYAKDMQEAFRFYDRGWSNDVMRVLKRQIPKGDEVDYRGFEWHLLKKLTQQSVPVQLAGHLGPVNGLAVFDEGRRLASAGNDGTIRIWDVESNREIFQLVDPRFAEDSRPVYWTLDVTSDNRYLVAGSKVLTLWDLQTREFLRELTVFPTHVTSAVFSPNNQLVAAHCADRLVKVVSLRDGSIREFVTDHGSHRLTFSADGRLLIAPFKNVPIEGIRAWDTSNWHLVQETRLRSPRGLVLSSEGDYLFYGIYGNRVRLAKFGEESTLFESKPHRAHQSDIDLSPDNTRLAVVFSDDTIAYWDLSSDWRSHPREPIEGEPTILATGGGRGNVIRFVGNERLAVGSADGVIRIWEIEDRETDQPWTSERRGDLYLSPDGTELWCETFEGVAVLDAASGEKIGDLNFEPDLPKAPRVLHTSAIDFTSSGEHVAIGRSNGQIVIWDRQQQQTLAEIDLTDQRVSKVVDLDFSPDGNWLASACNDHTIRVYSSETWNEVFRLNSKGLDANVEFSPDGARLAVGLGDSSIALLEAKTWNRIRYIKTPLEISDDCLRFSPNGQYIVTGHVDSVIRVWDSDTLSLLGELRGHEDRILDVDVDPNSEVIFSTSYDGSIRIWYFANLTELGVFLRASSEDSEFLSVRFSPCGNHLFTLQVKDTDSQRMYQLLRWTIEE